MSRPKSPLSGVLRAPGGEISWDVKHDHGVRVAIITVSGRNGEDYAVVQAPGDAAKLELVKYPLYRALHARNPRAAVSLALTVMAVKGKIDAFAAKLPNEYDVVTLELPRNTVIAGTGDDVNAYIFVRDGAVVSEQFIKEAARVLLPVTSEPRTLAAINRVAALARARIPRRTGVSNLVPS